MVHVFTLIEGRKTWIDLFIKDITKRRYPYETVGKQLGFVQPNLREIRFYDISIPKDCLPFLMADLAPYVFSDRDRSGALRSPLKAKVTLGLKLLRLVMGLNWFEPIPDTRWKKIPIVGKYLNRIAKLFKEEPLEYKSSEQIRHQWINTAPIGIKEDQMEPKTALKQLPKGGETV